MDQLKHSDNDSNYIKDKLGRRNNDAQNITY